eukprot:6185694-Pleurochrysis_carterae.AAC.1
MAVLALSRPPPNDRFSFHTATTIGANGSFRCGSAELGTARWPPRRQPAENGSGGADRHAGRRRIQVQGA